jgi:hypothetical protein
MPTSLLAKIAAAPPCPACGPVPGAQTSRYCPRHLRELRARWLTWRAAVRESTGARR